jgi:hypothetical protein
LISGHRYRGANPILPTLGMHIRGSALPFWCGFAEARKLGIFPSKGTNAVHILRPQLHSREEAGESGEVTLRRWASYRLVAVFNAADLEGEALAGLVEARKAAEGVEAKPEPERLVAAEAVLGSWPVPVSFGGIGPGICPALIGPSCLIAPASTHRRRSAPPGPMSRSTPRAMNPGSSGIWAVPSGRRAMPARSWSPN